MNKIDRFFRSMALLCLGVIIGFLISPIKNGIKISVGSGNTSSRVMNDYSDDLDEFRDYDEDTVYETPDEEISSDEEISF